MAGLYDGVGVVASSLEHLGADAPGPVVDAAVVTAAAGVSGGPVPCPSLETSQLEVPVGRRVMVVSDLLLTPTATPTTKAVTAELARALDTWDGPGVLIVAGNLFDLTGEEKPGRRAADALAAHPHLVEALRRFLGREERRVLRQIGDREAGTGAAWSAEQGFGVTMRGVEPIGPLDLHLHTGTGTRVVRVQPGGSSEAQRSEPDSPIDPGTNGTIGGDGLPAGPDLSGGWRRFLVSSSEGAPWLDGLDRLDDPASCSRFVVSRILYRRLGRYVWWLLVPFLVVFALRLGITPWLIGHAGNGLPGRALRHAHSADLGDQVAVAILVAVVGLAVLAIVIWLLSRRVWSALGGGALEAVHHQAAANDVARDDARRLVGHGYAGLVTASTFEPELTHLGVGFFANVGASTQVTGSTVDASASPPCSWPPSG